MSCSAFAASIASDKRGGRAGASPSPALKASCFGDGVGADPLLPPPPTIIVARLRVFNVDSDYLPVCLALIDQCQRAQHFHLDYLPSRADLQGQKTCWQHPHVPEHAPGGSASCQECSRQPRTINLPSVAYQQFASLSSQGFCSKISSTISKDKRGNIPFLRYRR